MSAMSSKKPSACYTILGVFFVVLGTLGFLAARTDAAHHVIRYGSYKTGYAPIYPWQGCAFSVGILILGAVLLYPAVQRLFLGERHSEGNLSDAESRADAPNET
jgi:hypothetical protein